MVKLGEPSFEGIPVFDETVGAFAVQAEMSIHPKSNRCPTDRVTARR